MTVTWENPNEQCKKCGACVDVCPNRIWQKNAEGDVYFLENRIWSCIKCGHCMAVCPQKAVRIPGLNYETDFYEFSDGDSENSREFFPLIRSRRAIRTFLDKPVPHEMLEKVVDAIRYAPPGFPPVKTELTVIEDPEKLKEALPMMIRLYDTLVNMMGNPLTRLIIRREAGPEKFHALQTHMIPLMIDRLPDLKAGREDTILRHAPALILFHANRKAENYAADIYIALTYGFLAAHALGLGASAMDLIPPAVDKSRELRDFFQIPDDHIVVGSMILGYPKHHFKRGIIRDMKSLTWL